MQILYSDRCDLDPVRLRSFPTARPFEWTPRHLRSPYKDRVRGTAVRMLSLTECESVVANDTPMYINSLKEMVIKSCSVCRS